MNRVFSIDLYNSLRVWHNSASFLRMRKERNPDVKYSSN